MSDQPWIDKFAIQELIYRHSDAIPRRSSQRWNRSMHQTRFGSTLPSGSVSSRQHAFFDYTAGGTAKTTG